MNAKEKMKMQTTQEFVCNMLKQRNAGTDDCITSSELAQEIGIPVTDLHQFLKDKQVLCRREGGLRLTLKYQEQGYEKYRSTFRYNKAGILKEIVYPVWTVKGQRLITEMLNLKN